MGARKLLSLSVVLLAAVAAACSKGGGGIATTVDEWKISLEESSASAGSVTFDVNNEGTKVHEFVIFQTDLAEDALPTTTDENDEVIVDEEGTGLSAVDEVEDVTPGSSKSLTADLAAGTYVMICNRPGHYEHGMHATFTVS